MSYLGNLVNSGQATLYQIVNAVDLKGLTQARSDLRDPHLGVRARQQIIDGIAELTTELYALRAAVEDGTRHPDAILAGYELFLTSYNFRKQMTGTAVPNQVNKIMGHLGTMRKSVESGTHSRHRYKVQEPEKYGLKDVREAFKELGDVYDPNNLGNVVEALNIAYKTPRLVKKARDNFGSTWYNGAFGAFRAVRIEGNLDRLKRNPDLMRKVQDAATILRDRLEHTAPTRL